MWLPLVVLPLLSGAAPYSSAAQEASAATGAGSVEITAETDVAWKVGSALPELVLPTVDGDRTVALSELRGRPVIVLVVAPGSEASRQALADAARRARELAHEPPGAAPQLEFVAIARELHSDRARLLAAWLGVTFPILWDPFVTVAPEVPYTTALVDAGGIVRALDVPLGESAMLRDFVARTTAGARQSGQGGAAATAPAAFVAPALAAFDAPHAPGSQAAVRAALSRVLWPRGAAGAPGTAEDRRAALEAAFTATELRAASADAAPLDHLRAGHVRWLRHTSSFPVPGDATVAVKHWLRAAAGPGSPETLSEPLRRLGPRLAKREPAYAWALRARYELEERAEVVPDLDPPLLGAEVLGPSPELPRLAESEPPPDPERQVTPDPAELLCCEGVAVPNVDLFAPGADTTVATARVLLVLAPGEGARFDFEAPAPRAWLVVPQGFGIDRNLHELALDSADAARGATSIDVELVAPAGVTRGALRGYVLAHVFDREGRRVHLRRDFHVPVPVRPDR
jgi:hypothetical protein